MPTDDFSTVSFSARTDFPASAAMQPLPSKIKARLFIDCLIDSLFPVRCETAASETDMPQLRSALAELLIPCQKKIALSEELVDRFFQTIPVIYEKLSKDATAMLEYDPAAGSLEEIVAAYPGFYAIAVYRFAHELYQLKIPVLPRMISEYAHSQTGIDIHPGARIGCPFSIDHGTGFVIGETAVIGAQVKIYQGVTIGALNVRKEDANIKRHPTLEDDVVVYSGATILGGNTVVGRHTVIGGNVWLTESVPPYSIVYHKSEVKVRTNRDFDEPVNFVI